MAARPALELRATPWWRTGRRRGGDHGPDGINWGGLDGWHPVGVFGVLIALAVSPVVGFVFGTAVTASVVAPSAGGRAAWPSRCEAGEWVMSAALSFSLGANDAQKAMGVTAALLVAGGRLDTLSVPLWVKVASGAMLTLGTAMGGWTIVRTIGRRIFHLHPIDGFSSQTASTAVILASSLVGEDDGRRGGQREPVDHPPRTTRASRQIRSETIGLRLCGIADEPLCPLPNGSSTSRTSVRAECLH